MDVDSELDQRKLAYVRLATGEKPQSQTSVSFSVLFITTSIDMSCFFWGIDADTSLISDK